MIKFCSTYVSDSEKERGTYIEKKAKLICLLQKELDQKGVSFNLDLKYVRIKTKKIDEKIRLKRLYSQWLSKNNIFINCLHKSMTPT